MAEIKGRIHAPVIAQIAAELLALVQNNYTLRALQSLGAPQACYYDRQTLGVALGAGAPANTKNLLNQPYTIDEARSGSETFTTLVITFDTASGLGFYRVDGGNPTITSAGGGGHEIPAGGGIITIQGHNNIKNFAMINQTGTTLPFARNLYK